MIVVRSKLDGVGRGGRTYILRNRCNLYIPNPSTNQRLNPPFTPTVHIYISKTMLEFTLIPTLGIIIFMYPPLQFALTALISQLLLLILCLLPRYMNTFVRRLSCFCQVSDDPRCRIIEPSLSKLMQKLRFKVYVFSIVH